MIRILILLACCSSAREGATIRTLASKPVRCFDGHVQQTRVGGEMIVVQIMGTRVLVAMQLGIGRKEAWLPVEDVVLVHDPPGPLEKLLDAAMKLAGYSEIVRVSQKGGELRVVVGSKWQGHDPGEKFAFVQRFTDAWFTANKAKRSSRLRVTVMGTGKGVLAKGDGKGVWLAFSR